MGTSESYWLTRFVFEKAMGLLCLIAFIVALNQFKPLLGEQGLLPVTAFVKQASFRETPSLFFFFPKYIAFTAAAWLGIVLSCLVLTVMSDRFGSWVSSYVGATIWVFFVSYV